MVIKTSSAADIRQLIVALQAGDEVAREAALARLAVIGARAMPHLLTAYRASSDRSAHVAMLRAMEPMGDPRGAGVASGALYQGGDLGVAAVAVLRGLLDSPGRKTRADALEHLVTAALDTSVERRIRVSAIESLAGLGEAVRPRLAAALAADPDPVIRAHARPSGPEVTDRDAIWRDAVDGHLPDDPALLSEVMSACGREAPLGDLQTLVDRVRAREDQSPDSAVPRWRALRGSLHQLLALRGSRIALYDLRETLERATGELPPSFVTAMQSLGDASCLDAIATAYTRSATENERWKHLLGAAFRTIAARERVTRRHKVMQRIAARWPEAGRALLQ